MNHRNNIDLQKYKWLEKGKSVWVESPPNSQGEMFIECEVKDINEEKHIITVETLQGKNLNVELEKCHKCTYGQSDVSDMVDLEQLNEPELLWNIRRRYDENLIFTLCGPTLLIINPYTQIEKLFTNSLMYQHQSLVFSETLEYKSQLPHIYGLAGFALWQLFDNNRNQSIVISGESGAGKTQNTKYCLKFLASLGKNLLQISSMKKTPLNSANLSAAKTLLKRVTANSSKLHGIQDKILGCNQILEAFGNAKTIRNDNSSRFGKLIILLYGATKVEIRSAFITNYLLEKSRIVSISQGERNYHVFYYICKGCSQQQKKKYRLTLPAEKYYFLNQSTSFEVANIKDQVMFQRLKTQFSLYLTQEEIQCVLSIVSAVLNLGNIQFSIRKNQKKQEFIVIKGEQFLNNVAHLINISPQQLSRSLQFRKRVFKEEVTETPFRLDEAVALRDSFAKNLYQKLFNYLVYKLNEKIQIQKVDLEDINNRANRKSIGILDIFGFQILNTNSLEQFFINFANQKLQQLYVSYIFKEQQNQFYRQGLEKFSYQFDFADNKPIIQLIEHYPEGIIHLIDEASQLNKADSSLPLTISNKHPKNPFVAIPKFKNENFSINHSCSPVQYCTKGFTARNKDQFPAQMSELFKKIQNQSMKSIVLFDAQKNKQQKEKRGQKKFLATKFLKQINSLIQELYSSDCHFVRCIKPNEFKKPKMFNTGQVLQSLRNLGVLDSIKIRKLGYVYRRPFKEFCRKFYELEAYNYGVNKIIDGKTQEQLKQMVKKIVMKYASKDLQSNHILIGHNKILINQLSLNNFQSQAKKKRLLRIQVANRFKVAYRKHKFRQQVSSFLFSISILKKHIIEYKQKVSSQLKHQKIVKVQKAIKGTLQKIRLKKIAALIPKAKSTITRWWRLVYDRRMFLKKRGQVIQIQSHIRRYLSLIRTYKQRVIRESMSNILNSAWLQVESNSATLIQKIFRGYHVRIQYKQLIKQIQKAKEQAILRMKIIQIQKWWRYNLFKKSMSKYLLAAQKIQATFKAHLIRRVYKEVLKSVKIIQRIVKKHLGKKFIIGKLWNISNQALVDLEKERHLQISRIGLTFKPTKTQLRYILDTVTTKIQVASPIDLQTQLLKTLPSHPESSVASLYIHHQDKNDFQVCLLDVDIISSLRQCYEDGWSVGYRTIIEAMRSRMQYPVRIQVSDNFTCVISQKGKLYQFGEVHALGNIQYNVIQKGTPFKIVCGQYQGYLLNTDRELYTWGDNDSDQLMRGYSSQPCSFEKNNYLPLERIDNFQAKGTNRYLISFGRVYEYQTPQQPQKQKQLFKLTKQLSFGMKVSIQQIVASYNFVHFVTTSGLLYSKGFNHKGELGLGHTENVNQPQLNKILKENKEIIDTVSVGLKHTVCKTRLGYVYAWGDNSFKQVIDQPGHFFSDPQKIEPEKGTKAFSAVAGFRCSAILLQSYKVYGWGTNSSMSKSGFQRIQFQRLYQLNKSSIPTLIPLKLCSTWSRSMSLLYVNVLNQNKCKRTVTKQNILKNIKTLCKQWDLPRIFPPYNEVAENNLNLVDIKKYKFKPTGLRPSQYEDNIKNPFKQIEMLVQAKGQANGTSTLSLTAKQKLQEMFKILLQKKEDQEWTEEERRLFSYLQNPRIQKLIRNL